MAVGIAAAVKAGAEKIAEIKNTGFEGIAFKEIKSKEFSETAAKDVLIPDFKKAKHATLEALIQENREKVSKMSENTEGAQIGEIKGNHKDTEGTNKSDTGKEGLSGEEKQKIKEKTGWSDEIIDKIGSMQEYEIYKNAGLEEVEINGRKVLIRSDIDWDQKDEKGRTNTERMEKGMAPLDKDGNSIELHHIGQNADSPLAELTFKEHRCDGNDTTLHDKKKETEVHGAGSSWDTERQDYWKDRAEYNEGIQNKEGSGT